MEGLLFFGIGSTIVGGIGLFYSHTSGNSFIQQIKEAKFLSASTPEGRFGYVSGPLSTDQPLSLKNIGISDIESPLKYVALWRTTYEVAVSQNVTDILGKKYAIHDQHKTQISALPMIAPNIMIGWWSVASFLDKISREKVGEFDASATTPTIANQTATASPNIIINAGKYSRTSSNNGSDDPQIYGEQNRTVSGRVHTVHGIEMGRYYTIFGYSGPNRQLFPSEYDLVYPTQTPQQVIKMEEQNLQSMKWISGVAFGCGLVVCTIASKL